MVLVFFWLGYLSFEDLGVVSICLFGGLLCGFFAFGFSLGSCLSMTRVTSVWWCGFSTSGFSLGVFLGVLLGGWVLVF